MSNRYQGGFITASYNGLLVPDAPTIGTATSGDASASVAFTAPNIVGGGAITGYTAISSPGGFTGTGTSSPVTVSGLTNGTSYTFTVIATNAYGPSQASAASNSIIPALVFQVAYTTAGTYSFIAPSGLNPATVSVVCVGGGGGSSYGGGGGGGLGYLNGYSVTAGNSYTVVVGAGGICPTSGGADDATDGQDSYFVSTGDVYGGGGKRGRTLNSGGTSSGGVGGSYTGTGGGNGGNGGPGLGYFGGGGNGGAGGYSGAGGVGGTSNAGTNNPGAAGSGGGGGGGGADGFNGGGGGGGVGLLGSGSNGAGGAAGDNTGYGFCGTGGSSGTPSASTKTMQGGLYGGGGSPYIVATRPPGTQGAVRIIYSTTGVTRAFPSTNTGDL
jgi:hypothetical protein